MAGTEFDGDVTSPTRISGAARREAKKFVKLISKEHMTTAEARGKLLQKLKEKGEPTKQAKEEQLTKPTMEAGLNPLRNRFRIPIFNLEQTQPQAKKQLILPLALALPSPRSPRPSFSAVCCPQQAVEQYVADAEVEQHGLVQKEILSKRVRLTFSGEEFSGSQSEWMEILTW